MNTESVPRRFVPYGGDPLATAADTILQRCHDRLPDLSRVIVLLPNGPWAGGLRQLLLARAQTLGFSALLGPRIDELRRWVEHAFPVAEPVPNQYARELMLVEALLERPQLFGSGNPWAMAASLIRLFDDITLHQVALPPRIEDFTRRVGSAYGMQQASGRALTHEATLVYTLWQAWHAQIRAEGTLDRHQAYLGQLAAAAAGVDDDAYFLVIGPHRLLPAEETFLGELLARGQASVILHGEPATHPLTAAERALAMLHSPGADGGAASPYGAFLDEVYAHAFAPPGPGTEDRAPTPEAIAARAQRFQARHPESPAYARLFVFEADNPEQEAQVVDLQIRRWLLEGRRRVGVVTEDRRLARRLRALLERADVALRDAAGWALSTTSAAAALERWLEAVEEDFYHQPLIDLLRSPFALPHWERARLQAAVDRLERDVIVNDNIARGLSRYRNALASRRRRLMISDATDVAALLDTLEQAASPLLRFTDGRRHAPRALLSALNEGLRRLGLEQSLMQDAAGEQVLQVITDLQHSLIHRTLEMNWSEFRNWLGRALESRHFSPAPARSQVELLPLAQGTLGRYDALVIAGLDSGHLPGQDTPTPFFNEAVRRELGLPSASMTRQEKLHHFRALLEAAPQILLTVCKEKDAQQVTPSPWLDLLQSFHLLAYGRRLADNGLLPLVLQPATQVIRGDDQCLPPKRDYPAPRVMPQLIPKTLTATGHQQLIDCPYQFFAARCLALAPPEAVTERLRKSDYGERVHRVLQAFHADLPGLPGPFRLPMTAHNRDAAIETLRAISEAVFAKDLEDNFLHRGWLHRWLALIDDYVHWQIQRTRDWQVRDVEVNAVSDRLSALFTIKGRLDRIDSGRAGIAVIDYKTGEIPSREDIHSGEATQLPFYALLLDDAVTRVEYLCLDKNRFTRRVFVEGDALFGLRDETGRRLTTVWAQIRAGDPLPAWGDERTCSHCAMAGVCRRQAWQNHSRSR